MRLDIAPLYNLNSQAVNNYSCLNDYNTNCNVIGMTLGERLKKARLAADMTQRQLAKKSRVQQQTISRIENGLISKTSAIVPLAKTLRVRPEWLGSEEGSMRYGEGEASHEAQAHLTPYQKLVLDLFESLTDRQQEAFIQEMQQTNRQNDELYKELHKKREGADAKCRDAPANHEVESPDSNQRKEPPPPATVSVNPIQNPPRPESWGSKKKPGGQHG